MLHDTLSPLNALTLSLEEVEDSLLAYRKFEVDQVGLRRFLQTQRVQLKRQLMHSRSSGPIIHARPEASISLDCPIDHVRPMSEREDPRTSG